MKKGHITQQRKLAPGQPGTKEYFKKYGKNLLVLPFRIKRSFPKEMTEWKSRRVNGINLTASSVVCVMTLASAGAGYGL